MTFFKRGAALLTMALLLGIGVAGPADAAKPFKIEFDQSEIQLGALGGGLDSLPLDTIASGASLEGTVSADGSVTVPEGKFKMPELGLDEPIRLRGFMGIESPATGRFNRNTGRLELDAEAGIWISVNIKQLLDLAEGAGLDLSDQLGAIGPFVGLLGNLTCGFSPMDVHFTTESNSLASGRRFSKGPAGTGAITAEWAQLGPFAGKTTLPIVGDACALLKGLLPGLIDGGLGDLGGIGDLDLGGLDLAGLLDNLDDVNLGPSSITLSRSIDESKGTGRPGPKRPARPARLKVMAVPKRTRIRAGRMVGFHVKLKNVGGRPARQVRVCIRKPQPPATERRRCRRIRGLAPGASKRRFFRVRFRPGTKSRIYRVRFLAEARNTRPVRRVVKVRVR